jgi:hypothetical protein
MIDEECGKRSEDLSGTSPVSHDAGPVGEGQGNLVIAIALGAEPHLADEAGALADELAALPGAGADDQRQAASLMAGLVDRLNGGDGGFAPLAGAVEDAAFAVGLQDPRLKSVGVEPQRSPSPVRRPQALRGDGGRGGPFPCVL